ncbi:hypothetical protein OBV_00800 [Oscillibacter valericigenes Sjm18-20]|nr:hypothetical protein OBV_00800 [Oscillibacter valericigenes Sjm18-20]
MLYRAADSAKTTPSAYWGAGDYFTCPESDSANLCVILDVMLHGVLLLFPFALVVGLIYGILPIVTVILAVILISRISLKKYT